MVGEIASLVPACCYSWVVLPVMEEIQVLWVCVVQCYHGEMLVEMGNVSAIECASWCGLSWTEGMEGMDSCFRKFGGYGLGCWEDGKRV